VDGKDITGVPPWLRNVGMVFQNYALWPHMSVWDNVAFGLVERKEPKESDQAARSAPRWNWWAWAATRSAGPASCRAASSSAWRWRAPWSSSRKLLLLDEPLSNLDKNLRVQMREELKNLQRRWA
jgi:iron(III) transport system ATP-binding protein